MPKMADWRDFTKTSKAGLVMPSFRLTLPFGEIVLSETGHSVNGTMLFNQWSVRCSACGIHETPFTADSVEKAKKTALTLVKTRLTEIVTNGQKTSWPLTK